MARWGQSFETTNFKEKYAYIKQGAVVSGKNFVNGNGGIIMKIFGFNFEGTSLNKLAEISTALKNMELEEEKLENTETNTSEQKTASGD